MTDLRAMAFALGALACAPVDDGPRMEFPTCPPVEVDAPVTGVPTWSDDVAPLVFEHCVGCHRQGGSAPFALETADQAAAWAPAMAAAVAARTMPPPGPTGCGACNRYVNAPWLEDVEIATFQAWADAGAPAGDPDATPALPAPPAGLDRVDVAVGMRAPFLPRADRTDDYRCFLVDPGLDRDRFLTGFEVRPGDARVVHHVILYALAQDADAEAARAADAADEGEGYDCFGGAGVSGASFVAGWAPGTRPVTYPQGTGLRLAAGRPLILQIHYNLAAGAFPDQSEVGLRLEDEVPVEAAIRIYGRNGLSLEPGQPRVTAERFWPQATEYDGEVTVWGVVPHMHRLGRTLTVELWNDEEHVCLVDVATWDFEAQGLYFYETPVVVRGDDAMRLTCGWDTRSRDSEVKLGEGTDDEMCVVMFYGTLGRPEDVTVAASARQRERVVEGPP